LSPVWLSLGESAIGRGGDLLRVPAAQFPVLRDVEEVCQRVGGWLTGHGIVGAGSTIGGARFALPTYRPRRYHASIGNLRRILQGALLENVAGSTSWSFTAVPGREARPIGVSAVDHFPLPRFWYVHASNSVSGPCCFVSNTMIAFNQLSILCLSVQLLYYFDRRFSHCDL
jgi:hypothetical protein